MQPLETELLDSLDFTAAAAAEAQTWRNLLPPEPWLDLIASDPAGFGAFTRHRLEAGATNSPASVSRARKAHQQVRPVAVVGICERIAYQALSAAVLAEVRPVDRSADAYARFVAGPITTAFAGQTRIQPAASNKYVIEADIRAFYEYVDHAQLLAELELRTSTVTAPRALVALLGDICGRPFGLPQLLDPSDDLSEVYARIIERELTRAGLRVWRYNDDFRVLATGYDRAQAAIESIAAVASSVGLVLSERKTRIVTLENYFWAHWWQPQTDGDLEFKPELISVPHAYGDLEDDARLEYATDIIDRFNLPSSNVLHLDARSLDAEGVRDVGRAIGVLTTLRNPYALPLAAVLFEYAAQLGHRLGAYLAALADHGCEIGAVWNDLAAKASVFNDWQRTWLVYVARSAGIAADSDSARWVQTQLDSGDPLLRAEATLALAGTGTVAFAKIDRATRAEPEAVLGWYALAAAQVPGVESERLDALKASHRLIELIIDTPPSFI